MNASPSNPLLGAWHLQRWDIHYGDGRPPTLPYGAGAADLIVYTSRRLDERVHHAWHAAAAVGKRHRARH